MAHEQIGAVRPPASGHSTRDASPQASWFDRIAREYLKESALWPVLFIVLAHAAAFLAPLILSSVRDRNLPAMGAMAVLIVLSLRACAGDERQPPFGPISGILLAIWLLAAAAAYFANRWQLL